MNLYLLSADGTILDEAPNVETVREARELISRQEPPPDFWALADEIGHSVSLARICRVSDGVVSHHFFETAADLSRLIKEFPA